ncbi:MAG: alpha-E domain-containing protein [Opitutaceae bacterium]|jgi:uncharacterized alpha-E superfamily protein
MLSRVASLVYWMARQLERAENTARIVDVNAQLVLDLQSRQAADDPKSWEPLVYVTGDQEKFFELHGKDVAVTERAVVEFMIFDRRNPSSIMSCIAYARENARCIRDQLSSDVFETLNTFYNKLKTDDYTRYAQLGSAEYLNRIKTQIQLFYGVAESMIPRTDLWWFFQMGRYLERADSTSRILDVKYYMLLPDLHAVGSALDMIQWSSVLRSCSGFDAFRRSRRGQLNLERVVDYLVRDDVFPRSILYSISEAEQALGQITSSAPHLEDNTPSRLLRELRAELEMIDITAVIADGLHEFLDDIQVKVSEIHESMLATFVDYDTASAKVLA